MNLYTVVLENKHMISTFDEKGRKVGERTEAIKQVIHDLPYSTAMMYKKKDAISVTVTAQVAEQQERRSSTRTNYKASSSSLITKKAPAARPAQQTSVQQAAATGNMTAAINAKD